MGIHTEIQWADSTVNPTTGCGGCELWEPRVGGPCYAGHLHERRLAKSLPSLYSPQFHEVRMVPGRMDKAAAWPDLRGKARPDKPWLGRLPRVIFVGDLGDVLSSGVTFEFLADEVVSACASKPGRRHLWMLLTKRPSRLRAFATWLSEDRAARWPENLWVGTSVTDRDGLHRVADLCRVEGPRVRFVSAEPLAGAIDLTDIPRRGDARFNALTGDVSGPDGEVFTGTHRLDLVIVGGASTQGSCAATPFDVSWARGLLRQCRAEGVSCFIKQLGSHVVDLPGAVALAWPDPVRSDPSSRVYLRDHHGGDFLEWPSDLRVREFPTLEAAHA